MKLHIRVHKKSVTITAEEAIKTGDISFKEDRIEASAATTVWLSTLLYDQNGNEIFENDTLCDADNRLYRVIYRNGAFLAQHQEKKEQIDLPLYLLQNNGVIPAKII